MVKMIRVYTLSVVGCSAEMPLVECRGVEGCRHRHAEAFADY